MKRVLFTLVAVLLFAQPSWGFADVIQELEAQFKFFVRIDPIGDIPARFVYADGDHVHVFRVEDGKISADWETTNLGARASALFVADIEGDGTMEIVIGTTNGRVLIYSAENYDLLWENLQDRFESVEAMVSANIDRDPQEELIIVADELLQIYDGESKALEWQSIRQYEVQEIVLGNVDDDEQPEIIFNTGFVIDSQFFSVEFEYEDRFGDRIRLMDINDDGIPEIIGQFPDFTLRIFDVYAEREIW